jgi:hypothetical protein
LVQRLTQLVHAEWQKQLFPRKSSKLLERFTQSMVATFPTETRARLASVNAGRTVVVASASSGCTGTAVVPTLFGHADRGAKKMKGRLTQLYPTVQPMPHLPPTRKNQLFCCTATRRHPIFGGISFLNCRNPDDAWLQTLSVWVIRATPKQSSPHVTR